MIRKIYHQLKPHIPGSVSPMVACGRVIKRLHPEAKTVFIGPCLAKKAEARESDVGDAVDFVLTFQEIQEFFSQADIHPEQFPEDSRDHSSSAGRLYARTGGVSEAVENCLERIHPRRDIPIKTVHADGVKDCRALLAAPRSPFPGRKGSGMWRPMPPALPAGRPSITPMSLSFWNIWAFILRKNFSKTVKYSQENYKIVC